jgi:hypothetical protein
MAAWPGKTPLGMGPLPAEPAAPSGGLGRIARVATLAGLAKSTGFVSRGWEQGTNWLCPNTIVPADTLTTLAVNGWIPLDIYQTHIRLNGIAYDIDAAPTPWQYELRNGQLWFVGGQALQAEDPWLANFWQQQERFDLATLRLLLNRGLISQSVADMHLQSEGWVHSLERTALLDMRRLIPGPQQILDMAIRGALDPRNLGDDALGREYSGLYDAWARANGLTSVTIGPGVTTDQPLSLDFARAMWAAHWVLPTLGQYYEMRRRLRPSLTDPNVSADPSGIILDPEDETAIYQANAIHPEWRSSLDAISWKVPSVRWIDQMIEAGVLGQNDLTEVLIDSGFHPTWARRMARARMHKINVADAKQIVSQGKAKIESAWELGTVSDQDYLSLMQQLGLRPEDAQVALTLAETERQRKKISRLVSTIRQQVLTGQISIDDGKQLLYQLSLRADRITDYVTDWELELVGRRRILSAQQALKATEQGLISIEDLVSRLKNLRYNDADISIFVGELQLYLANRLAKAAADIAKAEEKARKDRERAIKQLQQAEAQARASLAKHGTPTQLARWLCEGTISEPEARDRLRFLRWPDPDIDRLVYDACVGKPPKPKQPKTATGPPPPAPQG